VIFFLKQKKLFCIHFNESNSMKGEACENVKNNRKNVYKNTLTLKCMNSESISKTDGSPTAIASPDVLIIITKD